VVSLAHQLLDIVGKREGGKVDVRIVIAGGDLGGLFVTVDDLLV
jgi:hypothetical protein